MFGVFVFSDGLCEGYLLTVAKSDDKSLGELLADRFAQLADFLEVGCCPDSIFEKVVFHIHIHVLHALKHLMVSRQLLAACSNLHFENRPSTRFGRNSRLHRNSRFLRNYGLSLMLLRLRLSLGLLRLRLSLRLCLNLGLGLLSLRLLGLNLRLGLLGLRLGFRLRLSLNLRLGLGLLGLSLRLLLLNLRLKLSGRRSTLLGSSVRGRYSGFLRSWGAIGSFWGSRGCRRY